MQTQPFYVTMLHHTLALSEYDPAFVVVVVVVVVLLLLLLLLLLPSLFSFFVGKHSLQAAASLHSASRQNHLQSILVSLQVIHHHQRKTKGYKSVRSNLPVECWIVRAGGGCLVVVIVMRVV